jgi:hypothetical protein
MRLEGIERRLTRLEDIEAIKQLKARYCEICDDDHNPERITSVFAEDAVWESAEFGTGPQCHEPNFEVHGDRRPANGTSWAVSNFAGVNK